MSVKVNGLDHLVINVTDVVRSVAWYSRILGMEVKVFDPGNGKTPRTSLVFGNQKINVRPRDADKVEWFTADHEAAGSDDLCFLTSSTPEQVVAHLKANGVGIEEGPVTKQGARGTLRSVYCRDPDGSLIEISSYRIDHARSRHHSARRATNATCRRMDFASPLAMTRIERCQLPICPSRNPVAKRSAKNNKASGH